jgi:hypothetical protein
MNRLRCQKKSAMTFIRHSKRGAQNDPIERSEMGLNLNDQFSILSVEGTGEPFIENYAPTRHFCGRMAINDVQLRFILHATVFARCSILTT